MCEDVGSMSSIVGDERVPSAKSLCDTSSKTAQAHPNCVAGIFGRRIDAAAAGAAGSSSTQGKLQQCITNHAAQHLLHSAPNPDTPPTLPQQVPAFPSQAYPQDTESMPEPAAGTSKSHTRQQEAMQQDSLRGPTMTAHAAAPLQLTACNPYFSLTVVCTAVCARVPAAVSLDPHTTCSRSLLLQVGGQLLGQGPLRRHSGSCSRRCCCHCC